MERYFLGGNTAGGFFSLYEETLDKLDKVIMLKGGAGTGKSTLMRKLAREASSRGLEHEEWYCSGDTSSLDGVYIPPLSAAVVDATAPHLMDPKLPVVKEKIVNLADGLNRTKLMPNVTEIEKLLKNKKRSLICAYEHLNIALCYKKQELRMVNERLDRRALTSFSVRYAEDMRSRLERCEGNVVRQNRRVFSHAITPDGNVTFYDCLRNKEIVLVRGSEESRAVFFDVLKGLVDANIILCEPLTPYETEGIITDKLAMVSEVGHMSKEVSEVVDLGVYEGACDRYALDAACAEKEKQIAVAVDELFSARSYHLEVEKFYVAAMDFGFAEEMYGSVRKEIFDA